MWFNSKIKIETIFDAFDRRNKLIIVSLAESLSSVKPTVESSRSEAQSTSKDFLRILNLECAIYTVLFFDFLLFQLKISDEKSKYISDYILKQVCIQNNVSLEALLELIKPREDLFAAVINSSNDHLNLNIKSLVERVMYADSNQKMCNAALAFTSDPFFTFRVFSTFQDKYAEGMQTQYLKPLLDDIKSKSIEGMS